MPTKWNKTGAANPPIENDPTLKDALTPLERDAGKDKALNKKVKAKSKKPRAKLTGKLPVSEPVGVTKANPLGLTPLERGQVAMEHLMKKGLID